MKLKNLMEKSGVKCLECRKVMIFSGMKGDDFFIKKLGGIRRFWGFNHDLRQFWRFIGRFWKNLEEFRGWDFPALVQEVKELKKDGEN